MGHDRSGAKQPDRFDPARAAILDDTGRFDYVPPAALLDALAPPPSSTLLDFGAGTGLYAVELARLRPDLRILALDEQPAMLERLHAALARADVQNVAAIAPPALGALGGRVERILALNVLHELGDDALGELRGLLAPSGAALFVDWNADVERPFGPPSDHVYSPSEAERRLAEAGFAVVGRGAFAYHYALRAVLA
ncbi:MAG: Methyltransferase type 11 [Candidatus Eremiobacteraeota bacterium]|jgi:SAM-dependent methyltransferase|nr:Methyltransferase type 11 [Candidatus Eremiobacteraeota bacterium]